MKQYFRITMLWLAVAMIAPMMTSCDEFFSLWDNPVTPALRVFTEPLVVGEGHSLKINATTQDHVMLTYASSDPSVAIVDAEGNVIGVSEGKATITVTAQGDDDYYRNQIFGTNTHAVDVAVVKYDPTAIKLLADAQKEGAVVSITFNLDGTDYIAYFRLINGEYVLQNGPAAARAAARAAAPARSVTRSSASSVKEGVRIYSLENPVRMTLTGQLIITGIDPKTGAKKTVDLIATWTDKETDNAIAQVRIDGRTARTFNLQPQTPNDISPVLMKKIDANAQIIFDRNTQDKADQAKAAAGITTGGTGTTDGNSGSNSTSSFSITKAEFSPASVGMLIGETLQLE